MQGIVKGDSFRNGNEKSANVPNLTCAYEGKIIRIRVKIAEEKIFMRRGMGAVLQSPKE